MRSLARTVAVSLLAAAGLGAPAAAFAEGEGTPGGSTVETVPSSNWPFDGLLEVTKVNDATACGSNVAGDFYVSVYRPVYDSTDKHPAALSIVSKRNGFLLSNSSSTTLAGSGTYDLEGISSRGYSYGGTSYGSYSFTVKPNTSSVTTATTVVITGTIGNWWGSTGCTATIRAVYQRRTG